MPPPTYNVAWHVEPRYAQSVRRRALTAIMRRLMTEEGVPTPAALSVAIVGDAVVRDLNSRYRGVDTTTDVLSFALSDDDDPHSDRHVLGELIISLPTAKRQAREADHSLDQELSHLVVHGVLHLLGYDHERERDARRMRAREEALLARKVH